MAVSVREGGDATPAWRGPRVRYKQGMASASPRSARPIRAAVAVRPSLDLSYDVIQSRAPQLVGVRRTKAEALALARWAAAKMAPATITVFAADGATVEEVFEVEREGTTSRAT